MPHIRIKTGQNEGKLIPLDSNRVVIGRDPGCDIVLNIESPASRHHASVYKIGTEWRIRDLGSLNGTKLNNDSIQDAALKEGDLIVIGDEVFVFEMEEKKAEPEKKKEEKKERELTAEELAIQERVRLMSSKTRLIGTEIAKAIVGQKEVVEQLLMALISNGHVLMIGMPGLAKTLMIRTLAEVLDLKFQRIQFTPDLMPSDITGTDILEIDEATGHKEYRFIKGPVFTNILLADEINRTPPKTQAALLESMQEHRVSAAGVTFDLGEPFFVLATQNPLEQEGTYPLPEAQLDRFMFSVYIDYPAEEEEEVIAKVTTAKHDVELKKVLMAEEILELQDVVRGLPISDHVVKFATRLARATRPGDKRAPDFIKRWVHCGAGPRATQYLVLAAKARAVLEGRLLVTADDVRAAARPVLRHRVFTNFTADSEGVDTDAIVKKLLEAVPEPGEKDYQ